MASFESATTGGNGGYEQADPQYPAEPNDTAVFDAGNASGAPAPEEPNVVRPDGQL